jgi:hypothetical protein
LRLVPCLGGPLRPGARDTASEGARLRVVERGPSEPGADALRALATALAPYLRDVLGLVSTPTEELVDVVRFVPAPKRSVMHACRAGRIAGASLVGRRWVARRGAVEAWLRELGPRAVSAADNEDDELEDIRRRIAGP